MPVTKSAAKRVRTSEKSKMRNKARKASLKTTEKKLRSSVSSDQKAEVRKMFDSLCSKLDKAAKVGTIHKNKANRKKSRLAKSLNKISG